MNDPRKPMPGVCNDCAAHIFREGVAISFGPCARRIHMLGTAGEPEIDPPEDCWGPPNVLWVADERPENSEINQRKVVQ